MSVINIDDYLHDISESEPSGPDHEYDPDFQELERQAEGKPEVQYGDTIQPAVPPEWKVVKKMALDLLGRTHDLRIAVLLTRSLMALNGMPGFADGLHLIRRYIDERWDTLHPMLDVDDDNDPIFRINSLTALIDQPTTIRELKDTPIIILPGLGPLTIKGLEIANGELSVPEDHPKLSMTSIDAAVLDADEERVQMALQAAQLAWESARDIERSLGEKVGNSQALNMSVLVKNLKRAYDFMQERVNRRGGGADSGAQESQDGASSEGGGVAAAAGGAVRMQAISGEICSREDVARMIDKICTYYERFEPSSPVPLVMQRAKRLIHKNFFEIMEDLAPDGINQVTVVTGIQPKQEEDDDGY
ncbi:type VI secretion system protein TssA [Massilia sp. W12]|uniref:type VI secretion system protein TssA n=1 Tax=Massilia sp. W12 TaxID=3126507 RepID=UPI0030CDF295